MKPIAPSELIINSRGAVYHLDLRPEELAPTVITVGDPARVAAVSKYFDDLEHKGEHREFITHTGRIGKKRITVLSSGIGPDNIDIVMNELDALVNVDIATRLPKKDISSLQIIRLGTTGSLQKDIPIDSLVASTHGLGIDNLLHYYQLEPTADEATLLNAFTVQTQFHHLSGSPYISSAAPSLLAHFVPALHHGITITAPGFYGPQGRVVRLGLKHPTFIDNLTHFAYGTHRISNMEMETAAIYGLGRLLGHHCLALNAVVANRVSQTFSTNVNAAVEKLIQRFLQTFADAL
ncbi:MAG: nucleoside phosphorylase [Sphingomonadales bacterium]